MLRLLYTILIWVLAPFVLLATAWRGLRDPAYRDRLGERLGFTRLRFDQRVIWVHAVSMGEVQAAAPLVRELRNRYPQTPLLLTTATPTGAQRVHALFSDSVSHAYLPYDTPAAVDRFLQRVTPRIAIVMETEVWPNLFRACARHRIPIVMASARLSAKSISRLRWLGGLFKPLFAADIQIATQTVTDADRFILLGAERSRVTVAGNIKFDLEIPLQIREQGRALREQLFPHRMAWVAGSTHEVEEQMVLDAHLAVCTQLPGALLILVPRHPQRFATVRQWLQSQGIAFAVRSSGDVVDERANVLLVDTLGELQMFYAAADVAFVGGTLVPVGGHNLLEPAAMALPVLAGPHNFNAPEIAQLLFSQGAAMLVHSVDELSRAVTALALDGAQRRAMGAHGSAIVENNRGALNKVITLVAATLERSR